MDFFETVEKRYSVRTFKSKPIEEEKLKKIFEVANLAPSAGNLQSFEIVCVTDTKKKQELARIAHTQQFVAEAPVVLVVFANEQRSEKYGKRGKELFCLNDADIACSYIQLAVTALGLGSVWVGLFDDDKVRKIVNAPAHLKPTAIIAMGYPDEEPRKKTRRGVSSIVHDETF
ncbi:MAG: nitroreductase family protein [Candidatus Aenigmatarchaeota archaeon]